MSSQPVTPAPSFRRAFAFSAAQKYLAFLIQLATTIVLARLLSPRDTGIFSLAAAAVGIGHLLRDFGMGDYVIAQKNVSQEKLRAAFTLTVLMAWGIAATLLLLAHPMARWYAEPAVVAVLQLLCLNFMLLPFGTVAFAMLSRQMEFGRIFVAQTGAAVLGAVVTVWAAWAGHGAVSMALGSVVSGVWTIAYLLVVQRQAVFFKPLFTGMTGVLRFGGALTAARLIEQAANRSSDFIIPGALGFHAAGLQSKTISLVGSFHEFFSSAVVRVATPAFAKAAAGSPEERQRYLQLTVMVATALWLFFTFLSLFAHDIILLMFGPQWLECVVLVQIWSIGAFFWAPLMLAPSLLTARGAVAAQMRIQFVSAPLTVAAFLVGAQYSLVVLGLAANVAMLVRIAMIGRALRQTCGIAIGSIVRGLWASAAVAATAGAAAWAFKMAVAGLAWHPLLLLPAAGAVTLLAALAAMWALRHPAFDELLRLVGRHRQVEGVPNSPNAP